MNIGTLSVEMLANLSRLHEDMRQAKTSVTSTMSNIEASVSKAKSVLASLGLGLGVGYFVTLVKGSIDAMDRLDELSKTTSIAVEQLAGLSLLAKQSGGDLESMATSINKLAQNMGNDAAKFKALGVSAKDPLEAFKQLSDVFVGIRDPQLRAAAMAEALGKSWAGAAPALSEGSKKIQELVDKGAQSSGITAKMTAQANELSDKWVQLTGTGGMLTRMVGPLLPLLNAMADGFLRAKDKANEMDTGFKLLPATLTVVVRAFGILKLLLEQAGTGLGGVGAMLAALGRGDFAGVKVISEELSLAIKRNREEFGAWEESILNAGAAAAKLDAKLGPSLDAQAKAFLDAQKNQAAAKAAAEKASADRKRLLDMDAKNEAESWEARVKAAQEYNDMMTGMSPEEWQQKRRLFDEQERGFAESRARFIESENEEREALHEASLKATIEARKKQLEAEKKINDDRLREWERLWGTVESTGKQVFVNLFSQGKSSFEGIGKALKASIIDMLYQLTVRRWIVNIGASVAGSMGISGAASAAGGGSLLESGASMFNTGSSLYSAGSSLYAGGTSGLLYGTGMAGGATLMEAGGAVAANYGAYSAASLSSVAAAEGLTVAAGAGGVGAGATAALAAIPVYGWVALAALAVAAYLGSQDNDNAEPAGAPGRFFSSFTGSQAGLLSSGGYSYMGERKDGGQYSGAVAANAAMQQQLDSSIKMLFDEYRKTAQAAGLSTGGLDQQILVAQREGATVQQAYQASLAGLSDELARAVIPNIESFRRVGESLEQTFRRLTSEAIGAKQAIEAQIAAMDAQGRAMMIQLLEERGLVVQAREATRALELEAAGGNLFGLQRQIHDAQDVSRWVAIAYGQAAELAKAFQKEAGALSQMASNWHDAAASLRAYGATLTGAGGQMSYGAAARAFGSVATRARLGDLDAMGQLPEVGEQFRLASLASSGSSLAYSRDVARIGATVGSAATLAERQESVALQQLDTMTTQVEAIIDLNETTQSVVDAVRQINGVITELIRINDESGRQSKRAADVLEQVTFGTLTVRTTAA